MQRAVHHHNLGQLDEAARLYCEVLSSEPAHAAASHNLGLLMLQFGVPDAALAHLKAALAQKPESQLYWLSYIDALDQLGQTEQAQQMLALGQRHGLVGDEMEALAGRLGHNDAATRTQPAQSAKAMAKKGQPAKRGKSSPRPSISQESVPQAERNQLAALFNAGSYQALESRARLLVKQYPQSGFAWNVLGAALQGQGEDALPALQKATALLPHYAEAHNNLGNVLQARGRSDEAAASYRRAIEINSNFPDAHNNLGNILRGVGQLDEAAASFHRALALKPDYAEAHNNLGSAQQAKGQFDQALASFHCALKLKPGYAEAHNNLGNALKAMGRLDGAVASYRKALEIKPRYFEAHSNLGLCLKALGLLDDAVDSFGRALAIESEYTVAHNNLGNALLALGQFVEAAESFRRALKIDPDYAEAHCNLGSAMQYLGQLDAAVESYRRAAEIKPDFAQAYANLGSAMLALGRPDDAVASCRKALEIKPDYVDAYNNLLFDLSHSETVDARALFAAHCRFGDVFEAPNRANWPKHDNSREPERELRIGFVSADLRNHAVAYFIEPVLVHLAAQPQLLLHAYYNHPAEDTVTQRLRGYLAHWHPVVGLSDEALAQKIRADGIDILIDLSGHTAKHRLLTFARKPAPLQVSWIGYPGTTGMQAMDYYLTDRYFLPPGQFDDQFTENIVQLPASAPFQPSEQATPVNTLPALSNGYLSFGSFNHFRKLNPSVIGLWAQLLRALPNARMVLGAMPQDGVNKTLLDWFAQEGIARERLIFYSKCSMKDYLALHHQVDICLDTFPYNGGTTTFHALWMGVPTLSLSGGTPAGRTGACILGHVGLDAFVAHDREDFVQKGLSWANNLAALAEVRSSLRERFAQSGAGQPALVAAALERALRIMWQRWCDNLPAESFEVTRQDFSDARPGADK